jgi:hypothetical protein
VALSVVEVPGVEFWPIDSTFTYTSDVNGGARWSTNTARADTFAAPLHLPAGATVTYLELTYFDQDPSSSVVGSLVECDHYSQNCVLHPAAGAGPDDCLTPGYLCSGNANIEGFAFIGASLTGEITIDNTNHTYRLIAGNGSGDANTKISGMVVGYMLQVRPAPLTSNFNDVPTSSPQFQFIEALYYSGITAGCGGGDYCPNSPLTRGQMAVFLAKALGLQWP